MQLVSSRNNKKTVRPAEAIVQGLSKDGGLFVPCNFPKFTLKEIAALGEKSYSGQAAFIAAPFLPDFSHEELSAFAALAYKNFPAEAAPVVSLDAKTHILELFHGPTFAFKDFALQFLPHLLTASLKKLDANKTAIILAATSGDTGSAALKGFSGVNGTKICVFYPHGGVSNIQKLQMTTQSDKSLKVIGIRGNFDDAQSGVKNIFNDASLANSLNEKGYILSSANSINWGRIVPQIVYYFSAYAGLVKSGKAAPGDPMNVVVPTGNFGNILAAYYAKKSGLPIRKLICASNQNNVLTDFINCGIYDKNRIFHATVSPSMDILISSNLERFLFDLYSQDSEKTKCLMSSLSQTGRFEIAAEAKKTMQAVLQAGYASDSETLSAIKSIWNEFNYLSDTHTAVALKVHREYMKETGDNTPALIVATASPFKFADSTLSALGITGTGNDFDRLAKLSEISGIKIPSSLAALAEKEEHHKIICCPNEMKTQLLGWLG